jgi:ribonuclease D
LRTGATLAPCAAAIVQVIAAARLQRIVTTAPALAELAAQLSAQPRIGLDTEFLRERTYRAQLCLLQVSAGDEAACIDPLALPEQSPLAAVLTAAAPVKVMHASRQDLEVLLPVTGLTHPVFDTQIAAALTGLPAQIGYAELVRRLLGRELAKSHTRTDWAHRPLSAAQLDYALDDVRFLLPLAERLEAELARLGRLAWLHEELAALADPRALSIDPECAWQRLKGLRDLDPARTRLARALAAWRERNAISHDRPRGWILDDQVLREIVLRVPRTAEALAAIPEMPAGLVKRRGAELLACISAAEVPEPPPPLPARARPDPLKNALLKKLAALSQATAAELNLAPEVLATRRDLEQLADGRRDGALLSGWRRTVIGERLLAAL